MKHNPDKKAGPTRKLISNNLLASADELTPVAELSSYSHPELVLSARISEILIKIVAAPNAQVSAARLTHWLAPITSRGRKKLRIEAKVYDYCDEIIKTMPTNAATRRRLWATVGRVRRVFRAVAFHHGLSSQRSKYAKLIVVSYFWARNYWGNMNIQEIAHALGLRRQALESAKNVLNQHLPERMRFPDFSDAV